jgi:uncharacterized repeat protein (TIGR03803 family)
MAVLRFWAASPALETTMGHLALIATLALPVAVLAPGQANANPLTTLFGFHTRDAGFNPQGALVPDGAGNFYGTTFGGGLYNRGAVFELVPPKSGKKDWTESILFNFNNADGHDPNGGLLRDSTGNLYGTTQAGGGDRQGIVFKLTPPAKGQTAWTETILLSFNGLNGDYPVGGLVADDAGNLYGTTANGDPAQGTVFELSPPASGQTAWTQNVLFSFSGTNGATPSATLLRDTAGDLFGTTSQGGADGYGIAFELTPPSPGQTAWTETVLTNFNGQNGKFPGGALVADKAGNLYGTTVEGGDNGLGTVYELTPPALGQTAWTETVLLSFNGQDGSYPLANLLPGKAGALYGTTNEQNSDGNVFKLTPPSPGQTAWTETVLAVFDGQNGRAPNGGLIADNAGNLYGVAGAGVGKSRYGLAFKLKP